MFALSFASSTSALTQIQISDLEMALKMIKQRKERLQRERTLNELTVHVSSTHIYGPAETQMRKSGVADQINSD